MEMFEIADMQSLVRQTHTKPQKSIPSLSQPPCSHPLQKKSDNWRVYQVPKHSMSFRGPHSSFLIREREHDRERGIK